VHDVGVGPYERLEAGVEVGRQRCAQGLVVGHTRENTRSRARVAAR
jgi:hypothetical protein